MKKKNFILITLTFICLFESCYDYATQKKDTKKEYDSFLEKNKRELELISKKCYELNIRYANRDSLLKIFHDDSLLNTIGNIEFVLFNYLEDYIACDFKLKIKENKCVDFFITRQFIPERKDTLWNVKIIDKSPCF